MKNHIKCLMVCILIVLVHSLPQELEFGDSGESTESSESETMAISSTASMTTPTTTTTTSTTSRPTRSTTTSRPFQPLRPNRPLASMVHSTLQTIESVVVTAGILATTMLESLMPSSARLNRDNNKSYTSNEITSNSQLPEYSTLDFRENELLYNFE